MAMVLDAFASYLQGMLTEMAAEEVHMLLGVSAEIDKMSDKLKDLKNFLADADKRNITDKSVQGWVTELKHAMYDATDILDDCQLKAMERGESTADNKGCCNPFLFCIRNPFHAHDMGTRIKALNERLNAIKQRGDAFGFINLGSYGQIMHASRPGNPSRETSGELDRSGVVGGKIQEDTRELVARILQTGDGVNNIMVVAIVGVGGIGKTTLAQNVFNNESIQSEFEKKIWLSVNQSFDKVKLLRTAITLAGGKPDGHEALAVLQPILITALQGKKVLLVMDDLWSHGAWESVLKTPLVKAAASGSRVLITTRDEAVARGMRAAWPHHHIDTLSREDAWSLLKKQVLSNEIDEDHIDTLKDIGLKIIEKCGGLPLAVKVVGGVLRQTEMLRRDWEQVVDDSKWSTTEMPQELNHAVYLSYEDMPPYLKQCFLYYSVLPKSKTFCVHDVIAMWISEGFIHGNSNDLEETGRKYYKELISRNLIEPDKDVPDQWSCSMHDVVRSFAQYMTRDEALIAHNGEIDILTKLNSQKFLRLSMETTILQSGELEWKSLQEQKSVRTLISIGKIKMNPGDSLLNFSSLRTLYIESEDVAALVESLHQLKHLRYLALLNGDISVLPENIGKMKLLQFINLSRCKKLVNLPDNIVKLGQLRHLDFPGKVSSIPREFRGLTDMRNLDGFPAHVDGGWCSLDELGPLTQLRFLSLVQLENISASLSAANARLGEKMHIIHLMLSCTSKLGGDGSVKQENGVSEEEQRRIQKVFDELCPPTSVQHLEINGYFGQQLPSWMMSKSMVPRHVNLKALFISDLACCTQLPNGLCLLPCLQFLQVYRAPCIRSVGTEFLHSSQAAAAPFPRLQEMQLCGMVEWEEWEWEEKVQAMPRLEELFLESCKLGRVPPGLASNARALRKLIVHDVEQISCIESFPSVVELTVIGCPDLESITNLPKVQKLTITRCPTLKVVKDVPELQRLVLEDGEMETLPGYLREVNPSYLELGCSETLLTSISAAGESGPEFAKFSHVDQVKAKGILLWVRISDLRVLYTRKPYSFDTNVNTSFLSRGTLPIFDDAQKLESVLKMPRRAFDHVCSLVKERSLEEMNKYTFLDGRPMRLNDRVAVALIVLNSADPPATIGSSVGVNESTLLQATKRFVRAMDGPSWPGTNKMEKIKSKFDKIYGLPNCCGVVHKTRFPFVSQNSDHEKNEDPLMQVVVDSDMRFTDLWFVRSHSENQQLSTSQDSFLFMMCKHGDWLNGSKLKVLSDGSEEVGEYIIGDAGYPLLPWLLIPYEKENALSESEMEFNKRHSEATAIALKALARWKDTWKWMQGGTWRPENQYVLRQAIQACCSLHNIVIEMEKEGGEEEEELSRMPRRKLADENAARARDILSQHLFTSMSSQSRVNPVDQKEQPEIVGSFGSGEKVEEEKRC